MGYNTDAPSGANIKNKHSTDRLPKNQQNQQKNQQ
jgi:hypothetical protein